MRDHLRRQIADFGVLEAKVTDEEGPRGDVDDGAGEGFVERRVRVAKAPQALPVPECLRKGFAEAQECVFGGVVVVNYPQVSSLLSHFPIFGDLQIEE